MCDSSVLISESENEDFREMCKSDQDFEKVDVSDSVVLITTNDSEKLCKSDENNCSSRLPRIISTLLIASLLSCQLFYLYQKLEEEKWNIENIEKSITANCTGSEPIEDERGEVTAKALTLTLLVSATPPVLLILLFSLTSNKKLILTLLFTVLSLIYGCVYGSVLTLFYNRTSSGVGNFARSLYLNASACAQESCNKVEPKLLNLACFMAHRNVDKLQESLPQGWLDTSSCPKMQSIFWITMVELALFMVLMFVELVIINYSFEKYLKAMGYYDEPSKDEPVTDVSLNNVVAQDFLYSFIGGLAIGAYCSEKIRFGELFCLCVLFHKVTYQCRDYNLLREVGYSKFKIFTFFLTTMVVALLGAYVSLLAGGAVLIGIQLFTAVYIVTLCNFVMLEFMLQTRCIEELAIPIGMMVVVLAAEYADPKNSYLTNLMSQLNTFYYD